MRTITATITIMGTTTTMGIRMGRLMPAAPITIMRTMITGIITTVMITTMRATSMTNIAAIPMGRSRAHSLVPAAGRGA